jgi:hypothetical protein
MGSHLDVSLWTATMPVLIGMTASLTLCLRQFFQYRAERERRRTVERLAERHGADVLGRLPDLARELRDPAPFDSGPGETATGLVTRWPGARIVRDGQR